MSAHDSDLVLEKVRLEALVGRLTAERREEEKRARREEARANGAEKRAKKAEDRLRLVQERLAALEGPKEPREVKERPTHSTKPPQLRTPEECWAALQRMRREVGKARRGEGDFWNEVEDVALIAQGLLNDEGPEPTVKIRTAEVPEGMRPMLFQVSNYSGTERGEDGILRGFAWVPESWAAGHRLRVVAREPVVDMQAAIQHGNATMRQEGW